MTIKDLYERHLLPRITDLVCGTRSIARQRAKVVPRAEGRVLEIGVGTGLNLAHYDRARVSRLIALDPGLHPLARERAAEAGLDVELIDLSAERIPLEDASVDSVVVTYTLCTIPDAHAALLEMRRVLKPNGRLLFSEHGLAPDPEVARLQRAIDRPWGMLAGGCHLDRDPRAMLEDAGFEIREVDSMYLPGMKVMSFHTWGEATPSAP